MTDRVPPFDEPEFLTVRVGGRAPAPERLLLIGPPRNGNVRVREWDSNSWNTPGRDRTASAQGLFRELEDAYAERRQVSEEMHRIKQWLGVS